MSPHGLMLSQNEATAYIVPLATWLVRLEPIPDPNVLECKKCIMQYMDWNLLLECSFKLTEIEYHEDLVRHSIRNYLHEIGTKFDDYGTLFYELCTKYKPEGINYKSL